MAESRSPETAEATTELQAGTVLAESRSPETAEPNTELISPNFERINKDINYNDVINRNNLNVYINHKSKKTINRIKRNNANLKKKVKNLENSGESIINMLFSSKPKLNNFFKSQINNINKKVKGRRYSETDKQLALSLFMSSHKAYRILSKVFLLPSVSYLRSIISAIKIYPGFNTNVFETLGKTVEKMDIMARLTSISFDEMSLAELLSYNVQTDECEGLEDFGPWGKTDRRANTALVFMARGITSHWKQPIGYFLSHGPMDRDRLCHLLLECISNLSKVGLTVKCIVSDQGPSNQGMIFKCLKITEDDCKFQHEGKDIFVFFDPPHLLKSVRNNLKNSGFQTEDGTVSWDHIIDFYEFDREQELKLAPKLSPNHIKLSNFSKMRVMLASQILSHSVSVGMKFRSDLLGDPSSEPTSKFIEKIDNLFDCFNSRNFNCPKNLRRPIQANSEHVQFLQDMKVWLAKIKAKTPEGKEDKDLPCLKGWRLSINSLLGLWDDLNKNHKVKFLLTSRLNQDCVENLFSMIRGNSGHVDRPTAKQFRSFFRQALIQSIFTFSSESKNCIDDEDSVLLNMTKISSNKESKDKFTFFNLRNSQTLNTNENLSQQTNIEHDYCTSKNDKVSREICAYISGNLIKTLKNKRSCKECSKSAIGNWNTSETQTFLKKKQYKNVKKGLTVPTQDFTNYIFSLEKCFLQNVDSLIDKPDVLKHLYSILSKCIPESFLQCKNCNFFTFCMQKYCRLRLNHKLNLINQDIKIDILNRRKEILDKKLAKLSHI